MNRPINYFRSKEIELFLEKKWWHRFFKVAVWSATISCFLLIIVTGFAEFSDSKITHRVFSLEVTYDSVDAKPEHISSYIQVRDGREAHRIISRVHDLWRDKTMGKGISPAVEDIVKYYDNVLKFFFEHWVREYKSNTVDGYIKASLDSDHVPAIIELYTGDFAERLLKQGDISVKEWYTFKYRILLITLLISILLPPFLFFVFQLFYYKVIIYVIYGMPSVPFRWET